MIRYLSGLLAALLLATAPLRAQSGITIQAPTIAQIVNGTITAGTAALPACQQLEIRLNVTTTGTATGTLQIFLEDSTDNGLTWNDLVATNTVTFGAAVSTQRFPLLANTDGPGLIRSITGATPGAGAEVSETVPAGARWSLLSIIWTLTTSATVANRFPDITIDDGAAVYFRVGPTIAAPASSTQIYNAFQGAGVVTRDGNTTVERSLPIGLMLATGHRIRSNTTAIQVGDQYSAVQYLVREWRDLPGAPLQTETFPAGLVRSGVWADRIRVREKVSGVAGSPVGPTYTITATCKP